MTGRGLRPSRRSARATLLPLPPTTSRTASPRTRSPGRHGGTVSVLSRQGFKVTHKIIGESASATSRGLSLSAPLSRRPRVGYGVAGFVWVILPRRFSADGELGPPNGEFWGHVSFCSVTAVCPGVYQQPLHHDPRAGLEPAGRAACGPVAHGLDQRDRHHPGRHLPGQRAGGPAGRPGRAPAGRRAAVCDRLLPDAGRALDQRRGRAISSPTS